MKHNYDFSRLVCFGWDETPTADGAYQCLYGQRLVMMQAALNVLYVHAGHEGRASSLGLAMFEIIFGNDLEKRTMTAKELAARSTEIIRWFFSCAFNQFCHAQAELIVPRFG